MMKTSANAMECEADSFLSCDRQAVAIKSFQSAYAGFQAAYKRESAAYAARNIR